MDEENIIEEISSVKEIAEKRGYLGKFWSIISYLGVLSLVPLILKIEGEEATFHIKQGVVLFMAEIGFTLIWIIPFLGWLIGFLGWIACALFSLWGIGNVLRGKKRPLPFIGILVKKIRI